MGRKSKLPVSQRREAVLMLLRREEPGAVLARRFEVSEATLYRWRDDFVKAGEAALCSSKGNGQAKRIAGLQRQIAERDRVIGELTIANRILKKTADGSY
jgi:transposase